MTTQFIIWGLGVLATVLGSINIMQMITFRAYKRKQNSEADKSEIDNLRSIIEQNNAEIGRLAQRVETGDRRALEQENKYIVLYDKYVALREEFNEYKLTHK